VSIKEHVQQFHFGLMCTEPLVEYVLLILLPIRWLLTQVPLRYLGVLLSASYQFAAQRSSFIKTSA